MIFPFFIIFLLVLSKIFYKSYFSPLAIYCTMWGIWIFLFSSRFIPFNELHFETKLSIYGSYISFVLGSLTALSAKSSYRISHLRYYNDRSLNFYKIFIFLTSAVGFFGSLLTLKTAINKFGFLGVLYGLSRQALLKDDLDISLIWGVFIAFNFTSAVLSGFYMAVKSKKYLFCYLPFVSITLQSFVTGGRASFLAITLLYFFSYILTKIFFLGYRKKKENKYIFIIIFLFITFIFTGNLFLELRSGGRFSYAKSISSSSKIPHQIYPIYSRTGSLAAFDIYLINHEGDYSWGQNLFYPIFHQLEKLNLISSLNVEQGKELLTVQTPIELNIYTYLRALHEDFGLFGTIMVPYFLGILSSFLYLSLFTNPTLQKLFIISYLYMLFITSVTEYYFYRTSFWISLFIGLIISIFPRFSIKKINYHNT